MTERCPLCHNTGRYPSQYTPGLVLICTRCEAGGRVAREEGERVKRGMADSAGIARAPVDSTLIKVRADAWLAVYLTLEEAAPWWRVGPEGASESRMACDTIRELADYHLDPRRRFDDLRDPGRAAAVALAIYGTALVVIAGCLLAFGLALRAGWVVLP